MIRRTILRANNHQRVSLVATALSRQFPTDTFIVDHDKGRTRIQFETPNLTTFHLSNVQDWTTHYFKQLAEFFPKRK
jgi:hypothetical protein